MNINNTKCITYNFKTIILFLNAFYCYNASNYYATDLQIIVFLYLYMYNIIGKKIKILTAAIRNIFILLYICTIH